MRWVRRVLVVVVVVVVLALISGWMLLAGSRAQLDGKLVQAALSAPATISRDQLGIATVEAGNRRDLAYAIGLIHAQERFFQMDLMRRVAAGELAELVGPPGISLDLNHRRHRFRARAQAAVAALPPEQHALRPGVVERRINLLRRVQFGAQVYAALAAQLRLQELRQRFSKRVARRAGGVFHR